MDGVCISFTVLLSAIDGTERGVDNGIKIGTNWRRRALSVIDSISIHCKMLDDALRLATDKHMHIYPYRRQYKAYTLI